MFFGGCTLKDNSIVLGEHKNANYTQKQNTKNIQIGAFSDDRREKPLLAVIRGVDGKIKQSIFAREDLGTWLFTALSDELKASTTQNSSEGNITLSANIKELYVEYTQNPAQTKNLAISVKVEMTMSQGANTQTKIYQVRQEDYRPYIIDSNDLSPFIRDTLSDIARSMTKDVVAYSSHSAPKE